jgi:hypothetical protein
MLLPCVSDPPDVSPPRATTQAEDWVKAAKADDAKVNVKLWDDVVVAGLITKLDPDGEKHFREVLLPALRYGVWYRWYRGLVVSFKAWVDDQTKGLSKEAKRLFLAGPGEIGLEALRYAAQSDEWEWLVGSGMFFWQWPPDFQKEAMFGLPPFWLMKPPTNLKPQRVPSEAEVLNKIKEKLTKFRDRGYIRRGEVRSLINLFHVPKATDIRVVFDGTRSGLNGSIWAPWFHLPTADNMCTSLEQGAWCGDHDFGEMFYNFALHEDLQPYRELI